MTMNSRRNMSVATAIHLYWWQLRALWKSHDLFYWFGWLAASQTVNTAFENATLLAPLNLHPDLMGPVGAKQKRYRFD